MTNLVQLEQQLLAHHLQRADLSRVLLLCKEHLAITALANLGQDLEVSLPQPRASLAEVRPFPTEVLVEGVVVFSFGCCRWRGILCFELREAVLASVNVGEKVVVVIEKVYTGALARGPYMLRPSPTKLGNIRQALDCWLSGLLQLLCRQPLRSV